MPDKLVRICGFEPFSGRSVNRSWQAVERLAGSKDWDLRELPVDFARLAELVPELLSDDPDLLLLCGERPGSRLGVEAIALNVAHARSPDNQGKRPKGAALAPDGPVAYRSIWDAPKVVDRLIGAGVPAELSHHAGTFACNAALYLALHTATSRAHATGQAPPPIGFLHVPRRKWPLAPSLTRLTSAIEICVLTMSEGWANC